jgi:serine-type D-Ala-D-Ala endopeptidase (penicillin-binding protein 7)
LILHIILLVAILSVAVLFFFTFSPLLIMATNLTSAFIVGCLPKMLRAAVVMACSVGLLLSLAAQAQAAQSKAKQSKTAKVTVNKATAKSSIKHKATGKRVDQAVRKTKVMHQAKASARPAAKVQRVVMVKGGRRYVVLRRLPVVAIAPPKPSYGQLAGLHSTQDPLDLKSSVAYVLDQDTNEILFQKNENAVLPIASLTKLMTGVVVSEAQLDMNEIITITEDDVDTEKGSRSRLRVGTQLTRNELMLLSLMSSENRAAHALGRSYPGGMDRFVQAMNLKARQLGMRDTRYVEPTGLSSRNQSSAKDLATLTVYAYNDKVLRELSTAPDHQFIIGEKPLNYVNTNRLVRNPEWEIGLQKTGFISEAGQCLIMQAKVSGRRLIMVFLDSAGKLSRLGDAERVRRWVEGASSVAQRIG